MVQLHKNQSSLIMTRTSSAAEKKQNRSITVDPCYSLLGEPLASFSITHDSLWTLLSLRPYVY